MTDVIFCDLDNTLALMGDRYPYAGPEVVEDAVNTAVRDVVLTLREAWDAKLFILTGRSAQYRVWTERWLDWHEIPYERLEMRAWGDDRADWEVKEEILDKLLVEVPDLNVRAVFDDRMQVCELWHRRGLPLFRVGDPRAEF